MTDEDKPAQAGTPEAGPLSPAQKEELKRKSLKLAGKALLVADGNGGYRHLEDTRREDKATGPNELG